jgi:hypothetical protein
MPWCHLIRSVDLNDKDSVKGMVAKIKAAGAADFTYFRWDERSRRYKKHPSTKA